MKINKSISLVIPVYNEAEVIEESIDIFTRILREITEDFEIIVVNDGSNDGTGEILKRMSIFNNKLIVIDNRTNFGSGYSLWNGFKEAKKELIISNFADRPFDLNELPNILHIFDNEKPDFIVVIRKDRSANTLFRKITSILNYILIRLLFRVKVKDFQFAQIYRKKILKDINVESKHTFVAPEIIIKLVSLGYKYKEYKANFYPRLKGKPKYSNPKFIIKSCLELLKFKLSFLKVKTIKNEAVL